MGQYPEVSRCQNNSAFGQKGSSEELPDPGSRRVEVEGASSNSSHSTSAVAIMHSQSPLQHSCWSIQTKPMNSSMEVGSSRVRKKSSRYSRSLTRASSCHSRSH